MSREGVAVRDLARRHGAVEAVAGIGLDIAPGEIVGLLGPNGAGKTTTIEAIAGLIRPDRGSIHIAGIDALAAPAAARKRLGVVLQSTGLPAGITVSEALRAFANLHDADPDIDALTGRFGLTEKASAAVDSLSGGQRQRLALALAFVDDPPVIMFDEPTAGLDPAMRQIVQDHILAMRAEGRAVLIATHDMVEASRLCNRVAIINRGRIVATGTPAALIAGQAARRRVTVQANMAPNGGWPSDLPGVEDLTTKGTTACFASDELNRALVGIVAFLDARGLSLVSVQAGAATLEDVIVGLSRP